MIKVAARLLGGAAAVAAALAIIGWAMDNHFLKAILPMAIPMNPVIAFCIIWSFVAMFSWSFDGQRRMPQAFSFTIMVIGLLKIMSIFQMFDAGVDQLFFKEKLAFNQMAPNTALVILLMGLGLFLWATHRWVSCAAIVTVAVISARAVLGYANGREGLYRVSAYIPMALNAAIAFCLICAAMMLLWVRRYRDEKKAQP